MESKRLDDVLREGGLFGLILLCLSLVRSVFLVVTRRLGLFAEDRCTAEGTRARRRRVCRWHSFCLLLSFLLLPFFRCPPLACR